MYLMKLCLSKEIEFFGFLGRRKMKLLPDVSHEWVACIFKDGRFDRLHHLIYQKHKLYLFVNLCVDFK